MDKFVSVAVDKFSFQRCCAVIRAKKGFFRWITSPQSRLLTTFWEQNFVDNLSKIPLKRKNVDNYQQKFVKFCSKDAKLSTNIRSFPQRQKVIHNYPHGFLCIMCVKSMHNAAANNLPRRSVLLYFQFLSTVFVLPKSVKYSHSPLTKLR